MSGINSHLPVGGPEGFSSPPSVGQQKSIPNPILSGKQELTANEPLNKSLKGGDVARNTSGQSLNSLASLAGASPDVIAEASRLIEKALSDLFGSQRA